ncbi:MAG: hypothetical protein IKC69_06855 [Clostridia bacterium]|nr:hypothetical protein [Clostridia bacterium]
MKRIVTLLICLSMILSLVACSGGAKETETAEPQGAQNTAPVQNEEKTEEEKKTEEKKPVTVEDTSMIEKLNAIPIANSSMSSDELRKMCVDYMRLACSYTYTPSKDYTYVVSSQELTEVEYKGQLYAGLPYVTAGSGSLYRVANYYDSKTGVLNISPFVDKAWMYGNACSGGVCTAWSRCINSVQFGYTQHMTQGNGYINVGPYTYPDDFKLFENNHRNNYDAKAVIKENGEQIMYQSYAALKLGDGIVNTGHVRMNSLAEPVVVYNADGTINGEESYITYLDQICYNTSETYKKTQSDGTVYFTQGGIDVKCSFASLYKGNYLPFTFEEFLDPSKVEKAYVDIGITASSIKHADLKAATVKSNYNISDIYFSIKDESGKVLLPARAIRCKNFFTYEVKLSEKIDEAFPDTMVYNYAKDGGILEVTVQLYNGELITAYTGNITYN